MTFTHCASDALSSCSQNLSTAMPAFERSSLVAMSRSRFRSIFSSQKREFRLGTWPHSRQPCQKHPSTKMARRQLGKYRSGLPAIERSSRHQPLMARPTRAIRNRRSVERLSLPRIAPIRRECDGSTLRNFPPGRLCRRRRSTVSSFNGVQGQAACDQIVLDCSRYLARFR